MTFVTFMTAVTVVTVVASPQYGRCYLSILDCSWLGFSNPTSNMGVFSSWSKLYPDPNRCTPCPCPDLWRYRISSLFHPMMVGDSMKQPQRIDVTYISLFATLRRVRPHRVKCNNPHPSSNQITRSSPPPFPFFCRQTYSICELIHKLVLPLLFLHKT